MAGNTVKLSPAVYNKLVKKQNEITGDKELGFLLGRNTKGIITAIEEFDQGKMGGCHYMFSIGYGEMNRASHKIFSKRGNPIPCGIVRMCNDGCSAYQHLRDYSVQFRTSVARQGMDFVLGMYYKHWIAYRPVRYIDKMKELTIAVSNK